MPGGLGLSSTRAIGGSAQHIACTCTNRLATCPGSAPSTVPWADPTVPNMQGNDSGRFDGYIYISKRQVAGSMGIYLYFSDSVYELETIDGTFSTIAPIPYRKYPAITRHANHV